MIISRSPFRISFFGGGTDYPSFYNSFGNGIVIGTTINKYCYITVRNTPKFFNYKYRIVWSKIEEVNNIEEIQHPVVRAVLGSLDNLENGLHIHHDADLPARNGLGSSSAFTVGFLNCIYRMINNNSLLYSKSYLAKMAIHVERNLLNEKVGVQDQLLIAHGGFNMLDLQGDDKYAIYPIDLELSVLENLQEYILLVYTGVSRNKKVSQFKAKTFRTSGDALQRIKHIAINAYDLLKQKNPSIISLGNLLDETWHVKRELNDFITNRRIDEIYTVARSNGAIGGKLLGSGGGGFMVFIVPPSNRKKVLNSLKKLHEVSILFDTEGTKIIYSD